MNGRSAGGVLLCCWLLLSSGCLMVPLLSSQPMTSKIVSSAATRFIAIGKTTREDVVHGLGAPDYTSVDERFFVYSGDTARTLSLLIVTPYGMGVGERDTLHRTRVEIRFDDSGRVGALDVDGTSFPQTERARSTEKR
jgi:hypothetical protein